MTESRSWIVLALLSLLVGAPGAQAGDWTSPVEVTFNQKPCISYRARMDGPYLAVEATLSPGWHTFAMDNARRASEKLSGRKALSQDQPTQISVSGGLAAQGPWFQSPPKDFSRPALRWFSWGFDDRALFLVAVRGTGDGPALVGIAGQVCTEEICKKVDVSISIPVDAAAAGAPAADLNSLVQVR